ncbi:MAG: hypothetical protein JW951_03625 [Lentisphaerae bacterium]|nr:hypothetical protein [Lentisphaerota bacterium]
MPRETFKRRDTVMAEEANEMEGQQGSAVPPAEPVAPPPETPAVEPAPAPAAGGDDMEEGKVFAILSYALSFLGLPFFLIPLIMRNNSFSLYHAKQCLMLWLAGLASWVISGILAATVVLACMVPVVVLAVGIFCLVLNIIGLINAVNLRMQPLPVIGKWAEDWFKGIRKV